MDRAAWSKVDGGVDLSLSTSCSANHLARPPFKSVLYKEPAPLNQFERNHMKGCPYATHEALPTNRLPLASKGANREVPVTDTARQMTGKAGHGMVVGAQKGPRMV